MKNHTPIGCDIDGVLADFNTSFAALILTHTGKVATLPPATWDWPQQQATVTNPELACLWNIVWKSDFWGTLEPLASVEEFTRLNALQDYRDLYFITARIGDYAKGLTEEWLEKMGIDEPTVLLSPFELKDVSQKGDLAKGLGLAAFLDDKPDNCLDVWKKSPSTKVMLFDAPFNHQPVCFKNAGYPLITRVRSITEWLDAVDGIHE